MVLNLILFVRFVPQRTGAILFRTANAALGLIPLVFGTLLRGGLVAPSLALNPQDSECEIR